MSSVPTTAASIQEQLAQYRRRKQQEQEQQVEGTPAPSTSVVILSRLHSVGCSIMASLARALVPDHLVDGSGDEPDRRISSSMNSSEELLGDPVNQQHHHHNDDAAATSCSTDQAQATNSPTPQPLMLEMFGRRTGLGWAVLICKVALWLVLWQLFIIWQFGAVYFLLTGFFLIWYNLRSGPKEPDEVSAYSVFNKDFRKIHGTYTSEQFEKEMLFKM